MIELTLSPTGKNIAVNPNQVVSIRQLNEGCQIRMSDGGDFQVVDDYNAVVTSIGNNILRRK